ncbi:zeta toxin family protein [Rathayibacter sp. PhB127]|uniref:zeta toxin family protein n=1 Tax=Rathayibacter sp. PhB127 TaxID=2485176 RepID=UPI00161C61BE|nr:zeta toxin family protein [Rathayibacter sp. PhB127]
MRRDREAIFLAGPPGAGKTTALDELLASTRTTAADWRILNADDVKDLLLRRALEDGSYESHLTPPDVAAVEADGEKVWPRERAALVHEESSMVIKRARDQSVRRGENVVVDGTLASADAGKTSSSVSRGRATASASSSSTARALSRRLESRTAGRGATGAPSTGSPTRAIRTSSCSAVGGCPRR